MEELHPVLRVLGNAGYRRLLVGSALYALGRFLEQLTVGWFVLQATGSVFLTAMAWAMRALPNLLFGSVAGAIADRYPRNRLLSITACVRAANAVAMAAAALLLEDARTQAGLVLILVGVSGTSNTLQIACTPTLAVDSVAGPDRGHAISAISFASRAVGVVGVLAGGFALAAIGPGWMLLIAGLPWVVAAGLFESVPAPAPQATRTAQSLLRDVSDGLRVLAGIPVVTRLLALMVAAEVLGFSFGAFTPVIAEQRLGVGAEGLGALLSATAFGAMLGVGALSLTRRTGGRARFLLFAVVAFGALVALVPVSTALVVSLPLIALLGACAASIDALQMELLQRNVPDDLRGRVIGAWNVAIGVGLFGPILIGALAEWVGIVVALGVAGALLTLLGLVFSTSRIVRESG